MSRKAILKHVKKIVIKIGTSNLTEDGILSSKRISLLVNDIVSLLKMGYKIAVVTSGAISAGAGLLNKKRTGLTIPEMQAMAAIGQIILMNEYRKHFSRKGYEIGQMLLTEDDVKHRKRYLNARNTFLSLLNYNVIPIINENDSVAIKEIKFGDNDTLSAHVANIIEADLLILLSDVEGFYLEKGAGCPVEEICEITDDIICCAGGTGSIHGSGGMITKLRAAEIVIRSGEMMIIANGRKKNILSRIMNGEKIGTLFKGEKKSLKSRKRWIAFGMKSRGTFIIDKGAVDAICSQKKSLLASGIISSKGDFDLGDAVDISNETGKTIGKGIVNYNFEEISAIMGKKTSEIKKILGGSFFHEVINRDDLIIY